MDDHNATSQTIVVARIIYYFYNNVKKLTKTIDVDIIFRFGV